MVIVRRKVITQNKMKDTESELVAKSTSQSFGLVLDIGTTAVALALYQLPEGRQVEGMAERNSQTIMGKEVMMRLMHCVNGRQEKLHQLIVRQVDEMVGNIWEKHSAKGQLCRMVVVGNPAMCHIFLNQPVERLAVSPFQTSYQGSFRCRAGELGMLYCPQLEIVVLPGIAGHVGADAVAVILAESFSREKIQLAVDIGTNAEMILNRRGELSVCSAAAGPAFEGMGISCGMRGEEGAIAGVRLAPQTGNILLDVLAGQGQAEIVPKGICGSGLIDAVAQMVKYGVLQRDGYLPEGEFVLWEADKAGLRDDNDGGRRSEVQRRIVITQEDIRSFQTAKAAVEAGMQNLLAENALTLSEVDEVIIAGVFGSHVSRKNAEAVGLFPTVEEEKLHMVGNAALRGARKALVEEGALEEAEHIAGRAKHLELARSESFQDSFLKAMELSPWK